MTLSPTWAFDDSPIPDPHGRAERMLRFADVFRHPAATGDDRRPLPWRWQRRIVERILGPSNARGEREVRTVFMLLPRGARKTTLTSVLALGHTIGPEQRPRGLAISAASDTKQARLAFDEARDMLAQDPRFEGRYRPRDTLKRIEHPRSGSTYMAISADADAAHGSTPHYLAIDELHVWPGYALWTALKSGASKVPGSLTVITTTAGERAEGVCWEIYKYALDVLHGRRVDPTFLPVIFAADPAADWLDEDLWHAVNPGLADGFPDLDSLRAESLLAREIPALAAGFKQTHLNIWCDASAAGWIAAEAYDDAAAAAPIDPEALAHLPATVAVDMSKTYDMTGIVAAFRDESGLYTALPFAFLPETAFRKRSAEAPGYDWAGWRESGALVVVPGDIIPEDVIEAKIRELAGLYAVQSIGFDPKFAGRLMARLAADDLPALECPQTAAHLAPMYVEWQRAMLARKFRHGGSPVLRHAVLNAVPVVYENSLFFLSKKKSSAAIDLAVACGMAVGLLGSSPPEIDYFASDEFDANLMVLS